MGIFDFFNKKKKERERQEQLRLKQEAEAKRRAEEQRRQAEARLRKRTAYLAVFSTDWCGPSKLFLKEIQAAGITCFSVVNAEENEVLTERYSIRSVPTTLLLATDGVEIKRWQGYDDQDPGQSKFVNFIKSSFYDIRPFDESPIASAMRKEKQQRLQREQEEVAKRKADEQHQQAKARQRAEEQRKQQEQQRQDAMLSNFDFDSNFHQRYENGTPVQGLQVCPRFIKIRKNTNGCPGYQLNKGDGYILTATNGDTGKPQFAPKPMRVVKFSDNEILLKGYTVSAQTPFGWQDIDFSDYGFSIILKNGKVDKCVLHMYDRNVDLEYRIQSSQSGTTTTSTKKELTETEKFVNQALAQLQMGNDGDATYHPLYKAWRSYHYDPSQLSQIQDSGKYGMGLMIFLSFGTISDIDDQQQLTSLAYLFISKAINETPSDYSLYKNRILLMLTNHEAFQYTVSSVVNTGDGFDFMGLSSFEARDSMYKMEFADLNASPLLLSIDMLASKYRDLKSKITSHFFGQGKSEASIISEGKGLHTKVLAYLEDKVIKEKDIDF